jgi:hypothetical protein
MTGSSNRPSRLVISQSIWLVIIIATGLLLSTHTRAEVVKVEVLGREPFADGIAFGQTGPYERIHGKLTISVDPNAEANSRIADLRVARRSADGRVECRSDFFLLKPVDPSRGNGVLLYDVNNRGNKLALEAFNGARSNDPRTIADAGDGFLMRHGYCVLWCGWNGEVQDDGTGRLLLDLPLVVDDAGQPISGTAHLEFCVTEATNSRPFSWSPWGISKPFPAIDADHRKAMLTMRPRRDAEAIEVPHNQWAFARLEADRQIPDTTSVYIQEGFRPGWLYDLVYQATDARVTGLGFAAIRDSVSFFRYGGDAEIVGPFDSNIFDNALQHAYIFGISQSGRVIHHLIHDGFNTDTQGRQVFDAALMHVAGAGKGMLNHRFRMTTDYGTEHEGYLSGSEFFPFTPILQTDPLTGQRGDTGERARQRGHLPKMIFTQSSTEYWSRAASLLHTDVTGSNDLVLPESMRVYLVASSQHLGGGPATPGICQQARNPLDDRPPVLRAMLVNLDRWVREDVLPPKSRYPRLDNNTLVDLPTWHAMFPRIPGVNLPNKHYQPYRLDFGPRAHSEGLVDSVPPQMGPQYPTFVPAVDDDGNDIAGIRLPEVAVPLATYTGWNLRAEEFGAGGVLSRLDGMFVPLAKTKAERIASGDPRLSIEERYASRDAYLGRLSQAAIELYQDRLLLAEDALQIIDRASRNWPMDEPNLSGD